jgi:hypothetical protein
MAYASFGELHGSQPRHDSNIQARRHVRNCDFNSFCVHGATKRADTPAKADAHERRSSTEGHERSAKRMQALVDR